MSTSESDSAYDRLSSSRSLHCAQTAQVCLKAESWLLVNAASVIRPLELHILCNIDLRTSESPVTQAEKWFVILWNTEDLNHPHGTATHWSIIRNLSVFGDSRLPAASTAWDHSILTSPVMPTFSIAQSLSIQPARWLTKFGGMGRTETH